MYNLHSILIQLKKEDTPLHGVMVRCVRCFYQWLDPTLWEGLSQCKNRRRVLG